MKKKRGTLAVALLAWAVSQGLCQVNLPLQTEAEHTGPFRTLEDRFAVWNGREYVPLFVKGINLGVAVPGTQPGELAATREQYRRWFSLIREAGYNTLRVYTLHYPHFYEELATYNRAHPGAPLFLVQGIWLDEETGSEDLYDYSFEFMTEIRKVVRAVHGDATVDPQPGKASGAYAEDVSSWVLAYLAGREVFPNEIAATNALHPLDRTLEGIHLSVPDGDPAELWIARMLDHIVDTEQDRYGEVRPVGFSSWPTLDPIDHPTEALLVNSTEDKEQVDLSKLVFSESSGGGFISYHAYPYYPDFIVHDPDYGSESDAVGPNSYLGYLKALKAHYGGMPLLIAEFGVPSSWGSAHEAPSGMNHGGMSEEEQGEAALRMLENIREAGCAGGIQFSLFDEWFKQTWITNALSDATYRHLWHNIASPEQNFGILRFDSRPGAVSRVGDFPGQTLTGIGLIPDYAFLRVRAWFPLEDYDRDTVWIAFDTFRDQLGESRLPNGTSLTTGSGTLRAEFALSIPLGADHADLFVIPSYDIFDLSGGIPVDTVVPLASDAGKWNPVRWKTDNFYNRYQLVGRLDQSDGDDPRSFLDGVSLYRDSLEVRIPWTLLNVYSPTQNRVLYHMSHLEAGEPVVERRDTVTDGIALTLALDGELYQTERYLWPGWDWTKLRDDPPLESKKLSFHILRQGLPLFNSPPVGRADTFEIWPGTVLDLDAGQGVLANDMDPDGNDMVVSLAFGSGTSSGQLALHPGGALHYVPADGFRGEDEFFYYLDDGMDQSTLVPVCIRVQFPLDVTEPDALVKAMVYPNPGVGQFCVHVPDFSGEGRVSVTDMTGRELWTFELTGTDTWIDLAVAQSGLYLFRVQEGTRESIHRIIKR
ncbi:MAG: Ig-like domain-containing protein [Bacteroidales bacterium]